MHQDPIVADAVEIIDEALDDLETIGCNSLDSASALISAGFVELRDSDEPVAEQLEVYRHFIERFIEALAEVQARIGGSSSEAVH